MSPAVATQDGTTIEERSTVPVPPTNPQERPQEVDVTAQADLLTEYVASAPSPYQPWNNTRYIQALPHPSDDIMRDFGSKIYDVDMMFDPQVYSTLSILIMAVLAQGIEYSAPIEQGEPDYEEALTILRFCNWLTDNLATAAESILYELLDGALKMGNKVGELIWDNRTFEKKKVIALVNVKTKPHEATAFVVDAFNNELGLIYVRPGQPLPRLGLSTQFAPSETDPGTRGQNPPKLIPRSKFVIPRHKPRNGDPRGTSHIRSVYTPWWKKQQWNPQHLAFVTRFAQPSMYANLSREAVDIPVKDPATGKSTSKKSIVKATRDVVAQMKGGAAAALIDTQVNMLESKSNGQVIFESYNHEDRQIAKGVLMQTLTTEESQYMARAAGSIHQDVFGILVDFVRGIGSWTWKEDVLKKAVRYNYGDDAAERLTPNVSLGNVAVQDIPALMGSVAQLANAKGVHRSQWPKIWPLLNLPPANMKEWEADQKLEEQAAKQAAQPPEQGGQPGQMPPNMPPKQGQPAQPPGPSGGNGTKPPAKTPPPPAPPPKQPAGAK